MAELRIELTPDTGAGEIYKLVQGDVDVKVLAETPADVVSCLNNITDLEQLLLKEEKDWRVTTVLKHLPFDVRVAAMKWALDLENATKIVDPILILNVFNMIKGYTSFDDSFFNNPHIIVNSMTELADMKRALKEDLKLFMTQLSNCFLSILRSASVTEFQPKDEPKRLSSMMHNIISMADFITLSSVLRKADVISTDKLFNVVNASGYLLMLSKRFVLGDILAEATLPKEKGE